MSSELHNYLRRKPPHKLSARARTCIFVLGPFLALSLSLSFTHTTRSPLSRSRPLSFQHASSASRSLALSLSQLAFALTLATDPQYSRFSLNAIQRPFVVQGMWEGGYCLRVRALKDSARASAAHTRLVAKPEAFRHASSSAFKAQSAADARVARHHHQRAGRRGTRTVPRLRRLHRHIRIRTAWVGPEPTHEASWRRAVAVRRSARWRIRSGWCWRGCAVAGGRLRRRNVLRRKPFIRRHIGCILVVWRHI